MKIRTFGRVSSRCFALLATLGALSCGAETDPGTDTNTNWVKECTSDSQCGESTSCQCEICTVGCENDADCSALGATAVCRPDPASCAMSARICVPSGMDFADGDDDSGDDDSGGDDTGGDDTGDDDSGDDDSSDDDSSDDDTGDDDSGVEVWSARAVWSTFDADRRGSALVVGPSGDIFVTGGQGRGYFDLSVLFENFWVARFSSSGEPGWEWIETVEDNNRSNGHGIALLPDATITTVATIYDGNGTPILQRFDPEGVPLDEFSVAAGVEWLSTSPSGELVGAGMRLIEYRDGRPFTELWVGGLSSDSITWEKTIRGIEGSFSFAWDLVVSADTVFVAGSQGTASDSNASDAWLGAGALDSSEFAWDLVPATGGGTGRSDTIALTPDGGIVVAGFGDQAFVHRYEADGTGVWQRSLELRPSAIVATDAGYAVGYDYDGSDLASASARIDFFDWDGALVWRFEDSACERVDDLVAAGDLIALLGCNDGLGLFRIPVEQTTLGGIGIGAEALRACANSDECEAGHTCEYGTCAADCTATDQCLDGDRCVQEQTEQGACPFLGPGEPGTSGVCLPRCSSHEDCTRVAPSLTCLNNNCVIQVPECEARCLFLSDGCEEGCSEIRARGVTTEGACFSTEEQLLGCHPEGRTSTSEDGCVKSPDGTIYSAGGVQAAALRLNFGFTECTETDLELLSNASACE